MTQNVKVIIPVLAGDEGLDGVRVSGLWSGRIAYGMPHSLPLHPSRSERVDLDLPSPVLGRMVQSTETVEESGGGGGSLTR